jgi:hypothetical protein
MSNINEIIKNAKNQDSSATIVNSDSQSTIQQNVADVENDAPTAVATANQNQNPIQNQDMSDSDISALPAELQALLRGGVAPSQELGDAIKTTLGVDSWIQPSGMGLTAKDCDDILKPFKATLEYRKNGGINKIKTVQIESVSPTGDVEVQYVSTVDDKGDKGSDGRSWQSSVIDAYTRATQKGRKYPYDSAQMILVADEDVTGFDGTVLFQKGTKFGHSTPRTGWNNFAELDQSVKQAGLIGQKIVIEVANEKVSMKGRKPWGVLSFLLVGEAKQETETSEA